MRPAAGYVIGGDYGSNGGGSGNVVIHCQDCGNKPKKDCVHMRCRTCCRSRGLPCKTHIKSTWIPATKRRQRQQLDDFSKQPQSFMRNGVGSGQNRKRRRDDHQHHITPPPGFHFPAKLSSPAVFWCVRVNGTDKTEDQLAYQTTVSIGGHVFNGILYDHGPNDHNQHNHPIGETSFVTGSQHQVSLITPATTTTTITNPDFTIIDPSSLYPTPLSTYLGYDFTDYGLFTK